MFSGMQTRSSGEAWIAGASTIIAATLLQNATAVEQEASEPPDRRAAIAERVKSIVDRAAAEGFSGAVLVARDGSIVAESGAGFADLGGTVANTPDTLFEIASLTKQFTAAAILRLAQDGSLRLDDPISKHLPGVPESCKSITIEHLLRHTSGIPGTNSQGSGQDLEVVLPLFLKGGPRHEPGTHWEYWNQGYALLSEIVRRSSGRSWSAYCKERLFTPAGLANACFTGDPIPAGATVAMGRSAHGPPRSALEHPYGGDGFQYRGMGGAVCSVRDLWKWDRALCGDTVLNDASRESLFRPGLRSYGLGWFVTRGPGGREVHSHGGSVRGFICDMRRLRDIDGVIIVLSNNDRMPIHALTQALERALRGEAPGPAENLKPLASELAAALAGSFQSDRGTVFSIVRDGAATRAQLHWSPPSGPVTRAQLHLDAEGKVVILDGSDVIPIELERSGDGAVTAVMLMRERYRRTGVAGP